MTDDPRGRTLDDETLRYLEALLSSIVYGAGSLAITLFAFLFRTRRFDVMLLAEPSDRPAMPGARRYLPRLSFLLLNQIFYFYVTRDRSVARRER